MCFQKQLSSSSILCMYVCMYVCIRVYVMCVIGTSKSQLLSYVHKLTPRGIYTSGKGSSAVGEKRFIRPNLILEFHISLCECGVNIYLTSGLTASVVRDPETRDMVLESG